MARRCPDCEKFCSLETGEPEVEGSIEIDDAGHVTAEVRLHRDCADCGTEITELTLSFEGDLDSELVEKHTGDGHDLSVEEGHVEATESGGGRYRKNMIGADLRVDVSCSCDETIDALELHEEDAASSFESCC